MDHTGHHLLPGDQSATRSPGTPLGSRSKADDDDDPSQIDTIVLGDPADAPVPARKGDHVSPVHPTILIRLPRYGPQQGLIPATPAGHLLYNWLAAFNQANYPALGNALPTYALSTAAPRPDGPPPTNRRLQPPLRQRGSARRPRLPPPRPNPHPHGSPRHPPAASKLHPRHHSHLQPPRRPTTSASIQRPFPPKTGLCPPKLKLFFFSVLPSTHVILSAAKDPCISLLLVLARKTRSSRPKQRTAPPFVAQWRDPRICFGSLQPTKPRHSERSASRPCDARSRRIPKMLAQPIPPRPFIANARSALLPED